MVVLVANSDNRGSMIFHPTMNKLLGRDTFHGDVVISNLRQVYSMVDINDKFQPDSDDGC